VWGGGKQHFIGSYTSEVEAARGYDKAVLRLRGQVCACVCVCVRVCVCDDDMYVTCMCISGCLCLCVCVYLSVCERACTCAYVYTCPCFCAHMSRVGQNRIYTLYMTVYLVISLPIDLVEPRLEAGIPLYIWFWPTLHMCKCARSNCMHNYSRTYRTHAAAVA